MHSTNGRKVIRMISTMLLLTIFVMVFEPINSVDAANSVATSKYVTVKEFVNLIKASTGKKISYSGYKKNRTVTLEIAADLLVRASEKIYGETIDDATTEYIIANRIAEVQKITEDKRAIIAKAYALGLISGTSAGNYTSKRIFNAKSKCSRKKCKQMIARLINPEKRYILSPEYKLLRSNEKNAPVLADFYAYILADYPNEYYDCQFNFMIKQPIPAEAVNSSLWTLRECELYCGKMTWDTTFRKLTYSDRYSILTAYDSNDRLACYSAYMTPAEYDIFAKERNEEFGYLGMPLENETKAFMVECAKEYVLKAMNVDYRTIENDTEWQEFFLKNGITQEEIDKYISECIKDELIIECDAVAADISSMYYDKTPYTFKNSEGVVHTYAHYRVVSDNGTGFKDGGLIVSNNVGGQCLRNTRISEDGMRYEWVSNNEWQDGFFDIGTDTAGTVNVAVFDVMNYRAVYIEAFGYPCETPCYYPGTYTTDGMVALILKSMTKEEYLEKWGYSY